MRVRGVMVYRFVCVSTWQGNLRWARVCQGGNAPSCSLNEALTNAICRGIGSTGVPGAGAPL